MAIAAWPLDRSLRRSPLPLRIWATAFAIYLLAALDLTAAASVRHHLQSQAVQNPVFTKAVTTLSDSASVRVTGTTSIDGAPVELNLVAGEGVGGGAVGVGPAQSEVVLDGPDLYIKASALTWGQFGYGPVESRLDNRWVQTSPYTQPFRNFGEFANVASLASLLESTPKLIAKPPTTINGIAVIPLAEANGSGTTFYVTATDSPVLVAEKQASAILRFDEYGSARLPSVPRASISLIAVLQSQGL